jgi:tetratricopeptide (TPR) repeat protein
MDSNEPDDADALAGGLHADEDVGSGELAEADDPDGDDGITETLYELGAGLIMPHAFLHGIARPPLSEADRASMEHGILCLELWLKDHPESWQALWVLGKAHQRLGRSEQAGEFFLRSHEENPHHPDVARELVMECIAMGRGPEAVHFARTAVELDPGDITLQVNLALALLISGQVSEALLHANQALSRDPADEVAANVVGFVRDVAEGRRPLPTRLSKYPGPS